MFIEASDKTSRGERSVDVGNMPFTTNGKDVRVR